MLTVIRFDKAGACTILTWYSQYLYLNVKNVDAEYIIQIMFKITLNVNVINH